MPVLVCSLKSSILRLTSSQMDQTFWGVVNAAIGRLETWCVHLRHTFPLGLFFTQRLKDSIIEYKLTKYTFTRFLSHSEESDTYKSEEWIKGQHSHCKQLPSNPVRETQIYNPCNITRYTHCWSF